MFTRLRKYLLSTALLLIVSLTISAQDTTTTSRDSLEFIPLPTDVGKKAIKDLERYDLCVEERKSLRKEVDLLETKIRLKDSVISSKQKSLDNCKGLETSLKKEIKLRDRKVNSLRGKARKYKTQRNVSAVVGGAALVAVLLLVPSN